MEPATFYAGVLRCEMPVDSCVKIGARDLPSPGRLCYFRDIVNAAAGVLASECIQFDLSHIEPTAMVGSVDEFETLPDAMR